MKRRSFFLVLFFLFSFFAFTEETFYKIKKEYIDEGINILVKEKTDGLIVYYSLYNEYFKTRAEGKIKEDKLFVPYGTEVCIWSENEMGERSSVNYFLAQKKNEENLIQVISPKLGVWNKKQRLIINPLDDAQIMYSINGHDPEKFGLIYTEPVLIEKSGDISVWIKAKSSDGTISEKKIKYKVSKYGAKSPRLNTGDKEAFYKNDDAQSFKILSWHFLEFNFDDDVKYKLKSGFDNKEPNPLFFMTYKAPIFLDRNNDITLYWSCESYNGGKINKIELPKIPKISGIPEKVVNTAVNIEFDDERYKYFYAEENTPEYYYSFSKFKNLNEISNYEASLKEFSDSKYSCDIDVNREKEFRVKIPAFYKGVFQGCFYKKFRIDKIAPKTPDVNFYPAFSPTNIPVSISASAKNGTVVSEIFPSIYTEENNKIILSGAEDKPIAYKVKIYTVDEAGNKSLPVKRNITVDRNAIFVDSNSASKKPNGNPASPYSSPSAALEHINNYATNKANLSNEKWKIYLRGKFILNEALLITKNVRFIATGERASIRFTKNTGFVVNDSYFELENCIVFRREYAGEPRSVPLIYAANSTVKLNNVKLKAVEGQSVLNAFSSHLDIANTKIDSKQTSHSIIFNLDDCSAVFNKMDFVGSGNSILAISASKSDIELNDVTSSLKTNFTARFLQVWNSRVLLGKLNCIRLPEFERNKDSAVWYNRRSKIEVKFNPIIRGYSKPLQRGD